MARPSFSAIRRIEGDVEARRTVLTHELERRVGEGCAHAQRCAALLATPAPSAPVASSGKAASRWRRFIFRSFLNVSGPT